jgi:hypothetical protein
MCYWMTTPIIIIIFCFTLAVLYKTEDMKT